MTQRYNKRLGFEFTGNHQAREMNQTVDRFKRTLKSLFDKCEDANGYKNRCKYIIILYNYLSFYLDFIFNDYAASLPEEKFIKFIDAAMTQGRQILLDAMNYDESLIISDTRYAVEMMMDEFAEKMYDRNVVME